jgi:hypothetical protein
MRFTLKKSVEIILNKIDSQTIPTEPEHKHLGVFSDDKLSFNYHSEYIVKNCVRKWATLKRLCVFASSDILLQLYKGYTLPLINYCNYTWIQTETQENKSFHGLEF